MYLVLVTIMRCFINKIVINNVRHLRKIAIPLLETQHLIFTGKNGSGKTSVLEEIGKFLSEYHHMNRSGMVVQSVFVELNNYSDIRNRKFAGEFIIAYYPADR